VGFLDTVLGRTKTTRPNLDALFALPSAAVTLQTAEGIVSTGHAGVCWKPAAGSSVQAVKDELQELLQMPDEDGGAPGPAGALGQSEDSFGYGWLLLEDPDLDQLVARTHLVNSTLADNGWGPQLLCSVFPMVPGPEAGNDTRPFALVYLFKRGTFYPFAPLEDQKRDTELELRLRAVLGSDLPVEPDLSRWFPLWDLPFP
jgi:hypothetical protein